MHQMVDRSPTKLLQTVRLFYVRDGQRTAQDILANAVEFKNLVIHFAKWVNTLVSFF